MKTMSILMAAFILSTFISIRNLHGEARTMSELTIDSPAFAQNGIIPSKYTCDGTDVNPPLSIGGVPAGTKSLALIVDDPDAPAGTWVHWVVWNIGADTKEIRENGLPRGALQGTNDFRRRNYGGPCPPSGTHRYYFKLYALDTALNLPAGATKAQLEAAMAGHLLGKAERIGLYRRK